jgi:hypothetical protein
MKKMHFAVNSVTADFISDHSGTKSHKFYDKNLWQFKEASSKPAQL